MVYRTNAIDTNIEFSERRFRRVKDVIKHICTLTFGPEVDTDGFTGGLNIVLNHMRTYRLLCANALFVSIKPWCSCPEYADAVFVHSSSEIYFQGNQLGHNGTRDSYWRIYRWGCREYSRKMKMKRRAEKKGMKEEAIIRGASIITSMVDKHFK